MKPGQPRLATHVITRLIVGGAQENTAATVLGLQEKREYQTRLISGPTSGPEGSIEHTFAAHPGVLRIIPPLIRPVRPAADLKALFELRRIFRNEKPALVHTHSGKAGIIGRWAARLAGVPIIVHAIHGPSFGPWQGTLANTGFRAAERSAARVTTHFTAVANAMIDQYLAAGIGPRERYTRIFSGFPLEPYLASKNDLELRRRLGINPDDFVIGKIARLYQLKGHDDLFQIAPELVKRVPHVRFLLVGGGEWERRFRDMAAALELQNHFVFTGLVPPARIPALTGIMDALVHLSVREGLPRALPQAMAAGKPVAAYNCDGAGEVCIEGKTGFLIQRGDHASLLRALQTLAENRALGSKLGAAGREFVRQRFAVEEMVEQTHQLYLELMRRQGLLAADA